LVDQRFAARRYAAVGALRTMLEALAVGALLVVPFPSHAAPAEPAPEEQPAVDLAAKVAALEARIRELEGRSPPAAKPGRQSEPAGLIPGVLFGPRLSLISLPTPALGLEVKALNLFGASFDYGFIPTFKVSNVSVGLSSWKAGLKVYPFRGAFFLGGALSGYRFRGAKRDSSGTQVERLEITTFSLAPELGWCFVTGSGFFTSIELGWQFPRTYRSTLYVQAGSTPGELKDVRDKADEYLRNGLPVLGLLELGWFL
jgi:hypothetical protein